MKIPVHCDCGKVAWAVVHVDEALDRATLSGMRDAFITISKKLAEDGASLGAVQLFVSDQLNLLSE